MRLHEASDEAVARRAAELDGNGFESGGYLIRPAASVREILDEANAQHNCVAGFIDRYASGQTDLWVMRRASDPETPLVTVEVRDGAIRQAFQSHTCKRGHKFALSVEGFQIKGQACGRSANRVRPSTASGPR